jgi:hypothetical protein
MPERPITEEGVFERALEQARDITAEFHTGIPSLTEKWTTELRSEDRARAKVREIMERERMIGQIAGAASDYREQAARLLDSDQVSACDGTDALRDIPLMLTTIYACFTVVVSSRSSPDVNYRITESTNRYVDLADGAAGPATSQVLQEICNEIEDARADRSWVRTFREYCERLHAIDAGFPVSLIDGPLFTQNLMSQAQGRALYERLMAEEDRIYIGVIKELSGSWPMSKWCGYALRTGEVATVDSVAKYCRQRAEREHQRDLEQWATERMDDYIRCVYKPGSKAFGFECRRRDIGLAVALLSASASPTINHELPFLLEQADLIARSWNESATMSRALIDQISQSAPVYLSAVDLMDEREFRD